MLTKRPTLYALRLLSAAVSAVCGYSLFAPLGIVAAVVGGAAFGLFSFVLTRALSFDAAFVRAGISDRDGRLLLRGTLGVFRVAAVLLVAAVVLSL